MKECMMEALKKEALEEEIVDNEALCHSARLE